MYNFKPLSTPQQLSQQGGAPTGLPHPGSGGMSAGQGVPMSNGGGGPPPGISVGPNGQLVGPGGTPLNPQQLQGIIPQSLQQQFRAYQAARGAAGHTPIQPLGMGGSSSQMMQINPSQLSNAQAAMGVGGSQMGPPTGMTAPGRMGGAIGPVNPTGQWMNRIGASGPQRPARYQQDPTDILTKQKLQELIRQVAPNDRLEPEVEELLQDIAEDFVESVTTFACSLAKLRKSDCLDAKDVALHLERNWNLQIPGTFPFLYPHAPCVLTPFVCASGYSPELEVMSVASGSPTLTQSTVASLKRPLPEGHKQRLALVKKTMALQRKREEKEREKERKQREDQKERGKQQQQQQLQAHQQAEKQQQQQRTEASGELEKATTPDLEAEVKKEKSETESEAAAAAAGDEATTEKKEKKDNEEAVAEADEEEAGDEVKNKKQKTLHQEPAEAKRDGEASEKEAGGGDMQTE